MAQKSIHPGWTRVTAGHYRHAETGVEIKQADAYREHGYAVGIRWNIWATWTMSRAFALVGSARTLRSAIEWAEGRHGFIELAQERIADAWDEAHAEDARMPDASHLNLIGHVDDRTGASVGMYRGVDCAPIEWAKLLTP